MNLSAAILTAHAREQLAVRSLDEPTIRLALAQPDSVTPVRPGRVVAQKLLDKHLLRIFVDIDRDPPEVVTVYKTSKLDKYRSTP